jgi:DNA-binding transcriptional LysR family regulator
VSGEAANSDLTAEVILPAGITGGNLIANELAQQSSALRQRTCDFSLVRLPDVLDGDFEAETLFHEPVFVVGGARHALARRRKITLAELAAHRWALPTPGSVIGDLVIRTLRRGGVEFPPKGVVTGSVHMDSMLVASGEFLGFLPGALLHFWAKILGLKVLPVELTFPSSPFGIVRLKKRGLTPIARLFIDDVRETAKPLAKKIW